MRFLIPVAAAALCLSGAAHAACSDDANALAQKYGITASLPADNALPSSAASSESLAKSGGVIAPPATGDMAAANPTMPNSDHMQTAPDLPAQTAEGGTIDKGKTTSKVEGKAAADSQAASLLQAARAAGLKGDERACAQRLADARALLEKTGTKNP